MEVKFTNTTASQLSSLPIVDGQIIALTDTSGYYYDMGGTRTNVLGIQQLASLPESGTPNMLYIVIESGHANSYTWDTSTSTFVQVSSGNVTATTLTYAEYQELSDSEKMDGTVRYITDGASGSSYIDDSRSSSGTTYSSNKIESITSELQENFQAGVDGIYNTIVAQGTTPASKSLSDVEAGINSLSANRYNKGKVDYNPASATLDNAGSLAVKNSAGANRYTKTFSNNYNNGYNTGYNQSLKDIKGMVYSSVASSNVGDGGGSGNITVPANVCVANNTYILVCVLAYQEFQGGWHGGDSVRVEFSTHSDQSKITQFQTKHYGSPRVSNVGPSETYTGVIAYKFNATTSDSWVFCPYTGNSILYSASYSIIHVGNTYT